MDPTGDVFLFISGADFQDVQFLTKPNIQVEIHPNDLAAFWLCLTNAIGLERR